MPFPVRSLARPWRVVKIEPDAVLDAALAWNNPFERGYVKLGMETGRSIEAVCAWIAQDAGLPCPAARFVQVSRTNTPPGCPWKLGDVNKVIVFATVAIEGALQLTKIDSDLLSQKLLTWKSLESAAVFDQLIANDDRSDGNMLMDPTGKLWLIDHGRALGAAGHPIFSSDPTPSVRNFLLDKIARQSLADRMKRREKLMAACVTLAACVPRVPYDSLLVRPDTASQINSFLTQRASRLQAMVFDNVGLPSLYPQDGEGRSLP
jgi:hypothetical protein